MPEIKRTWADMLKPSTDGQGKKEGDAGIREGSKDSPGELRDYSGDRRLGRPGKGGSDPLPNGAGMGRISRRQISRHQNEKIEDKILRAAGPGTAAAVGDREAGRMPDRGSETTMKPDDRASETNLKFKNSRPPASRNPPASND